MSSKHYSNHQKNIIGNYYENLDAIMLQKLQELVTELYLADSEAKKTRLWERVAKAMAKLKVKASIAEHILAKKQVEVLAMNVQDWLKAVPKGTARKGAGRTMGR